MRAVSLPLAQSRSFYTFEVAPITVLRVLFYLSGISGLIYQVVWMRMLTRILGCTIYASSTVLATFMAGLALGSFLAGRWVDRSRSPVRWYGVLEIGIAASAISLPWIFELLVPAYQSLYGLVGGSGPLFVSVRAGIIFVLLLVPTAMMGATLPVLATCVERTREQFDQQVSWLYGLNTLGAMSGALVSGLLLLGWLGETWTVAIAAAINVLVGAAAVWYCDVLQLPRVVPGTMPVVSRCPDRVEAPGDATWQQATRWVVLVCFALSGLAGLGLEVIWTRQLVLFLGTSIYAFSIMLVLFLAGLGLGSLIGGKSSEGARESLPVLAVLQCLLGLVALVSQCWMLRAPPANPYDTQSLIAAPGPALTIFLFALVSGLMFPRVVRIYRGAVGSGGESLGVLYAANTIGCIAGSVLAGFVLIPLIGSSRSAVLLAVVNIMAALVLWTLAFRHIARPALRWSLPALTVAASVLVPKAGTAYDDLIVCHARRASGPGAELYYHREGAVAATTAFGDPTDPELARLWVNGVGMTHLGTVTKLMAHLPIMLHGDADKMLVICFGMGTTVRSAATEPELSVTAVELVPEVYDCFGYFHADGPALWDRPNIDRVVDDGRNFLLMNRVQFDLITIDPPPPVHSAGTVNLYTKEFFELCRARLRRDGLVCLWIPPVAKSELMAIMASFGAVFPHTTLWTAPDVRGFYCMGRVVPHSFDRAAIDRYLERDEVRRDLAEYGYECSDSAKLLELQVLDEAGFRALVRAYPVMTDDRPFTEFPLWRRLLRPNEWELYRSDDLRRELAN